MSIVYKIVPETLWRDAERAGRFDGAALDIADGFIHLSTGAQVRATAARHFAGQSDLLLVAVEAEAVGPRLRWEASRGGDLFPHLYGFLPMAAISGVERLRLGPDGAHEFPDSLVPDQH